MGAPEVEACWPHLCTGPYCGTHSVLRRGGSIMSRVEGVVGHAVAAPCSELMVLLAPFAQSEGCCSHRLGPSWMHDLSTPCQCQALDVQRTSTVYRGGLQRRCV